MTPAALLGGKVSTRTRDHKEHTKDNPPSLNDQTMVHIT